MGQVKPWGDGARPQSDSRAPSTTSLYISALERSENIGLALLDADGVVVSRIGVLSRWLPDDGESCFSSPVFAGMERDLGEALKSGQHLSLSAIELGQIAGLPHIDIDIRPDQSRPYAIVSTTLSRGADLVNLTNPQSTREQRLRDIGLDEQNRALSHANEGLRTFATLAAHDLRAPARQITTLSAQLQSALGASADPDVMSIIDDIDACSHRSQDMVNGLLTLALAHSGPLDRDNVALSEIVGEAARSLRGEIAQSDARIIFANLPDVCAHRDLMVQAIQNILSNSLKYRSSLAPNIAIEVDDIEAPKDFIALRISDNGVGLTKTQADRAFDLFYRASTASRQPGSGIGLAIVRAVIERHGGSISMSPGDPGGAVIRMTLPRARHSSPCAGGTRRP